MEQEITVINDIPFEDTIIYGFELYFKRNGPKNISEPGFHITFTDNMRPHNFREKFKIFYDYIKSKGIYYDINYIDPITTDYYSGYLFSINSDKEQIDNMIKEFLKEHDYFDYKFFPQITEQDLIPPKYDKYSRYKYIINYINSGLKEFNKFLLNQKTKTEILV